MKPNQKDEAFRSYALQAHPGRLLLTVCGPLAIYQAFRQLFTILDTMMAAHVSADAVSSIAVLAQITLMIQALGTGLAVGGSIQISASYGMGDYDMVRKRTSTLYLLAVGLSLLLAVLLIPFAVPFLRLLKTPEPLIDVGAGYFRVSMLELLVSFFNTVYIAVERSRGHSKQIMTLNLGVIVIKLGLSALFIYVLDCGVIMIAVATLISQLFLLVYALIRMPRDEGAFRVSLRAAELRRATVGPIMQLSYPVAAEKMLFAAGKVVVNSMAGVYGPLTAGALGVSNNIGGLTTNWHAGMLDGASALISQNRGAKAYGRTRQIFRWLLLVNVLIGLVGLIVVSLCLDHIAAVFAQSKQQFDEGFRVMIVDIHRWEMLGYITLGIHSAVNALLLGYGMGKSALVLNMARVFLFRIPVLWALQKWSGLGYEAVGVTMMVSNISTGVISILAVIPLLRRIRQKEQEEGKEAA